MWKKVTDLSGIEIIANMENVITVVRFNGGSKIRFLNSEEISVKEPPEMLLGSTAIGNR